MTEQDAAHITTPESTTTEDHDSPAVTRNTGSKTVVWILTGVPLAIILIAVGGIFAFFGWLDSNGIDRDWVLGRSPIATPPGSQLAGAAIGGMSRDEIEDIIGDMEDNFSVVSVWLVELPYTDSVASDEFSLSTNTDDLIISTVPSEIGISIDTVKILAEISDFNDGNTDLFNIPKRIRLWKSPPSYDLYLAIDQTIADDFLNGVKSTVDCEPINAVLDLENQLIQPSEDGISVDIESTLAGIPSSLHQIDDIPVELVIRRTPPEISNSDFSHIDIENPLATYTTSFATWKRNRSRNINLIAEHFEGVVIQPGEEFSFNETTGPRTAAEGYYLAPMYIRGRVELSPAGGACQVSTTLYNSALLAGLEVTERLPHSRPCSYVPYGRDATVAYGAVDLKFVNTLDHPIILHQEVDHTGAGTITFEIFGHPDDRVNVEVTNAYSWIGRDPSLDTYVVDTSLAPGEEVVEDAGTSGIYQRAWRTWYDENGTELYTEEVSTDRIRPIGRLVRHNPAGVNDDILYPDRDDGSDDESPSDSPPDETPPDEIPPGIF